MSAVETLQALAAGEAVASGAVLQHARLAGMGRQFYGEEEIVEHFRRSPLGSEARVLASVAHTALLWPDRALFADLSGDHIMRLWRLGPGAPAASIPQISVPFDPDMAQARGDLIMRAEDHPQLASGHLADVDAAGRDLVRNWTTFGKVPAMRTRAFCIRAFSAGDAAAALLAVYVLSGSEARQAGFVNALAATGSQPALVRDAAGMAALARTPWTPRAD